MAATIEKKLNMKKRFCLNKCPGGSGEGALLVTNATKDTADQNAGKE